MKKRTVYVLILLVLLCVLAYLGGYYLMDDKLQTELEEVVIQRKILLDEAGDDVQSEYYIARLEGVALHIYKMPENKVYDSVQINSLHLSEDEVEQLRNGIVFQNLKEVFEFLENSMS